MGWWVPASLWEATQVISPFLSTAPAMAPQNVQVTPLTASQLEVTWDPPPPESQNGNIQGYKASFHALSGSCSLLCAQCAKALAAYRLRCGTAVFPAAAQQ